MTEVAEGPKNPDNILNPDAKLYSKGEDGWKWKERLVQTTEGILRIQEPVPTVIRRIKNLLGRGRVLHKD